MSTLIFFFFLITVGIPFPLPLQSATTMQGNGAADTTFQFAVGKLIRSALSGATYSAAAQNDANGSIGNFAIARLKKGANQFDPIAPEYITLNITSTDVSNPLFNQTIKEIILLESGSFGNETELPVVITHREPNIIYLYEDLQQRSLLASLPLRDANAHIAQELIGLAADPNNYLFTFTKPANQPFGQTGSGIAALVRGFVETPEGRKRLFLQLDVEQGTVSLENPGRALALDNDSALVRVASEGSVQLGAQPSMLWDEKLNRLFVGLQVSSDMAGVRSLLVGRLQGNKLLLEPFVGSQVFDEDHNLPIVGSSAPNARANVYDLQVLHTSTGLAYVIVVANASSDQQKQIYALPIVNAPNNKMAGTLASVAAAPIDISGPGPGGVTYVASRVLAATVQHAEELPSITDAAVLVGNGIPTSSIDHIQLYRDAVLLYPTATEGQAGSVYKSQPLFDANGKIKGWTDWQIVITDTHSIVNGAIDTETASRIVATTTTLPGDTIVRTAWNSDAMVTYINRLFTTQNGGATLLDALVTTKADVRESSLIAIGGSDQLLLMQSGYQQDTQLVPTVLTPPSITFFQDGVVDKAITTAGIMLHGAVLENVGPLTATAIVSNSARQQQWLAVGGVNGLAILQDAQGNGWLSTTGIGDRFSGLRVGLQLQQVDNVVNVKKLIAQQDILYILTDTALIYIDSAEIGSENVAINKLADLDALKLSEYSSLTDVIIASEYIVLGTTAGLFTAILDEAGKPGAWKQINIPQLLPSIVQLSLVSEHNNAEDMITSVGANIYILSGDVGNQQSRVTRFDIKKINDEIILQPFNDIKIVNQPYYFLEFGANRQFFVPDGTLFMSSTLLNGNEAATLRVLPVLPSLNMGSALIGINNIVVNPFEDSALNLSGIITDMATGNVIVGADNGIRINQ